MTTFRLGDMIRIRSGPFAAFTGRVDGINQARMLLKVKVNIYGRAQPTKIKFSEAEKLKFAEDDPEAER
jgi:transcriptional antiterminator NusG